ncbi:unnamed protein product [Arctogadus glacialis]
MDAVETPCGTPGRVQAPIPLSSVATAPFYFQQPSGSASSGFTGYAPGTCPATTATAVPALAPAAYSLSQPYQSSFRMRLPRSGLGVSSKGNGLLRDGQSKLARSPSGQSRLRCSSFTLSYQLAFCGAKHGGVNV